MTNSKWATLRGIASEPPAARVPSRHETMDWRRAVDISVVAIVATSCAMLLALSLPAEGSYWLSRNYFLRQDMVLLLAAAVLLKVSAKSLGAADARPGDALLLRLDRWSKRLLDNPSRTRNVLAVLALLASLAGTYLVMLDYPMSRDELMAGFDAAILARGQTMAPMPQEWRPFARALLPEFGLPIAGNVAWASLYLPGNAGIRAFFSMVAAPQIANPVLAAIAVWAVFGIASRLWPDRPDAAVISALLLATSSQVLFMAMTSYAMTPHLALNLVWLNLFLRNDRLGHAGAIAVGALACGLHQIVFHPLFVAPFIAHLWLIRRWKTALLYSASYGLICLLWVSYRSLSAAYMNTAFDHQGSVNSGLGLLVQHALGQLTQMSVGSLELIALNLVRFAAWQNPLVLPLLVLAMTAKAASGKRSLPVPLRLGSISLGSAVLVAALFMPYQGHGWGYRYVHGYVGVVCLVATYGWLQIGPRIGEALGRAAWRPVMAVTATVTIVLLPVQAVMARATITPYAQASRALDKAGTEIVLVDPLGLVYPSDLVRNDPYLRNAPKILLLTALSERDAEAICARGPVGLFGRAQGEALGIVSFDYDPAFELAIKRDRLIDSLRRRDCLRDIVIR